MATTTYFPDQSAPNMPTETNFETQLKNDPDAYLDHLLNDLLSNPPTPSRPLSPCMDSRPDHSISSILGSPTHNQDYATGLQSLLKPNIIGMSDQTIKQPVATSPKVQLCGIETRESDLHKSLQLLQLSFPIEVQYMSSYYRYQSALIENNRYQAFYYHHPSSYGYLNSYYDSQLHHLIETVQGNIKALQNTETISYQQQPEVKTSPPVMGSSRPIISKKAIATMDTWYQDNLHHPYPTFTVIANLATQTGLKEEQVKKWFANKRNRRRNVRPYIKKQKTLTKTLVTQSLQ